MVNQRRSLFHLAVFDKGTILSPYLFLLVSEVLSRMIQSAVDKRYLDGERMNPNGPVISHLLFVNDTLIFLKDDKKNCTNLIQLLILINYWVSTTQHLGRQLIFRNLVYFLVPTSLRILR